VPTSHIDHALHLHLKINLTFVLASFVIVYISCCIKPTITIPLFTETRINYTALLLSILQCEVIENVANVIKKYQTTCPVSASQLVNFHVTKSLTAKLYSPY